MRYEPFALQLFICTAAASLAIAQGSAGLRLYDNFNQNYIDPVRWNSDWQCRPSSTECERSIQNNQLRLRVRGYGASDSSDGVQFGTSQLFFASPTITDIQAQVLVRTASVDNCSANTSWYHSQFVLWGAFFNAGGGTTYDDVQAYLQLDRWKMDPPGVLHAGGFVGYGNTWANYDLGPLNVGEKVTVELVWDQPDHRFVLRLFRPSIGIRYEQYMPYSFSDVRAAVNPMKAVSANVFPPNCANLRPAADFEVLIDDVRTN